MNNFERLKQMSLDEMVVEFVEFFPFKSEECYYCPSLEYCKKHDYNDDCYTAVKQYLLEENKAPIKPVQELKLKPSKLMLEINNYLNKLKEDGQILKATTDCKINPSRIEDKIVVNIQPNSLIDECELEFNLEGKLINSKISTSPSGSYTAGMIDAIKDDIKNIIGE